MNARVARRLVVLALVLEGSNRTEVAVWDGLSGAARSGVAGSEIPESYQLEGELRGVATMMRVWMDSVAPRCLAIWLSGAVDAAALTCGDGGERAGRCAIGE